MTSLKLHMTFFLTLGAWVLLLLSALEWLLPGYVLPYLPLPFVIMGFALFVLATETLDLLSKPLTAVIVLSVSFWAYVRLWDSGTSGKAMMLILTAIVFLMVRYSHEKHPTLS